MRSAPPDGCLDRELQIRFGLVAGVDEVGRGALAGPVVVAAVILDPEKPIAGLDDSKKLTALQRERLAEKIRERAAGYAVACRDAAEIDRSNILAATRAAMEEAVLQLQPSPGIVVTDAVTLPGVTVPVRSETKADQRYLCVAAASILAKTTRDRQMKELARTFSVYGWERNKGYPSPQHLEALRQFGPCELHRKTFAPVRVLA